MKPAAIGMAFLGLSGIAAPYINPNTWWVPAFSGLFMPLILIINFFLLIYWAYHKKTWFLLPLITIILNFNYITSMYQFPWKQLPATTKHKPFTIASYNIEGFYEMAHKTKDYSLSEFINKEGIDILCIQEHCEESKIDTATIYKRVNLPYRQVYFNRQTSWANFGISVYSRYPIIRYGLIDLNSEKNSSMWVDICLNNDTIRIFNNHLQTTNVSINRKLFNEYQSVKNWKGQARTLVSLLEQLKENFQIRAIQAHRIRQIIDTTSYPVIVCGDFNDTPISYAFNFIKGNNLLDGFKECGKGYGYSFNSIKSLLRIDYITYNRSFTGMQYKSDRLPWSDHNPIIMNIALQ